MNSALLYLHGKFISHVKATASIQISLTDPLYMPLLHKERSQSHSHCSMISLERTTPNASNPKDRTTLMVSFSRSLTYLLCALTTASSTNRDQVSHSLWHSDLGASSPVGQNANVFGLEKTHANMKKLHNWKALRLTGSLAQDSTTTHPLQEPKALINTSKTEFKPVHLEDISVLLLKITA